MRACYLFRACRLRLSVKPNQRLHVYDRSPYTVRHKQAGFSFTKRADRCPDVWMPTKRSWDNPWLSGKAIAAPDMLKG